MKHLSGSFFTPEHRCCSGASGFHLDLWLWKKWKTRHLFLIFSLKSPFNSWGFSICKCLSDMGAYDDKKMVTFWWLIHGRPGGLSLSELLGLRCGTENHHSWCGDLSINCLWRAWGLDFRRAWGSWSVEWPGSISTTLCPRSAYFMIVGAPNGPEIWTFIWKNALSSAWDSHGAIELVEGNIYGTPQVFGR